MGAYSRSVRKKYEVQSAYIHMKDVAVTYWHISCTSDACVSSALAYATMRVTMESRMTPFSCKDGDPNVRAFPLCDQEGLTVAAVARA